MPVLVKVWIIRSLCVWAYIGSTWNFSGLDLSRVMTVFHSVHVTLLPSSDVHYKDLLDIKKLSSLQKKKKTIVLIQKKRNKNYCRPYKMLNLYKDMKNILIVQSCISVHMRWCWVLIQGDRTMSQSCRCGRLSNMPLLTLLSLVFLIDLSNILDSVVVLI